jgi:hypothetical protein
MSRGVAIQPAIDFGAYVPPGGLSGQILTKFSGDDNDYGWLTRINEIRSRYFDCDDTLSIGKLVYPDGTRSNYVITSNDNRLGIPCIGIVSEKREDTVALIHLSGLYPSSYSGLVKGNLVFVGTDGNLTTTKPGSGWFQVIGFCPEDNVLDVNINYQMIKLYPF